MNNGKFIKGMSLGIIAGATLGWAVTPKRRRSVFDPGKAMRSLSTVFDNLGKTLS